MTSDNGSPCSPPREDWLSYFYFDGEHTKDLNQLEYDTTEAQNDVHEQLLLSERKQDESSLMRSGSMKRKEQCAKGKSRKKHRRAFHKGESSASQQQPEPKRKNFKEIMEEKSVPNVLKILKDRVNRRRNNDEKACMEKFMLRLSARNLIQWPLPQEPELVDILEKIKKIESDNKKAAGLNSDRTAMKITDEFKSRLDEVREALENLNEQRRKVFIKTENVEAIFTADKDVKAETLREELSSAFPGLVLGKTATNVLTVDHDQQ